MLGVSGSNGDLQGCREHQGALEASMGCRDIRGISKGCLGVRGTLGED